MTPAKVSQIVRTQLVEMGIPFRSVKTMTRPDGKLLTWVVAFDAGSAAEALRTLHPEHQITEDSGFASMVSDGRI